jgi:hypothetical protein
MPVRVKKTRQNKKLETGSDSTRTDQAPGGFSRHLNSGVPGTKASNAAQNWAR